MSSHLYYGQHPRFAVPRFSFPQYARVGMVMVGSGVSRLIKVELVRQAKKNMRDQALFEDKEFQEILEIILISGALE